VFTNGLQYDGFVYGDNVNAARANTWPGDHAAVVVSYQLAWP
jgi:hypothetical protein